MTPDYYVNQLKVYARYARNYNPRSAPDAAHRRRPGRRRHGLYRSGDEGLEEQDLGLGHRGLSLHSYTVVKWPPAYKATGFGEDEYATLLKDTLQHGRACEHARAVMDKYDPEKKIALVVDEWGAWLRRRPAAPKVSSSSRTASATR